METIKYYLQDKDYFGLSKVGSEKVRRTNLMLVICLGIFLFLFIFFIILYSCTNYNYLDELDDYVNDFKSNNISTFPNINIGAKIMPSYNSERNILYMHHSTNYVKSKIPNTQSLMKSYNLTSTYFRLNRTNKVFPKFKFTKDNIPVGDSVTMCLSLNWAPLERGNNFDIMKEVKGFPNCTQAESGKFIWNDDDPINGIDLPVWIQHIHEANCDDDECDDYCAKYYNGFFVNGVNKHVCYSYDILDGICVIIEYNKVRNEFNYVNGCFEGGKNYIMTPAKMNEVYYFSGVELEVRDRTDPIIKAGEMSEYSYSFGNSWRYIAYLMFIVLFVNVVFLIYIIVDVLLTKKKIKESYTINDLVNGEE